MADERGSGSGRRWVCVLGCLMGLLPLAGCELVNQEFRAAAGPALESGVDAILDGLVDGFFAILEPNATTE